MPALGHPPHLVRVDVTGPCPGWIVRQPAVEEGIRAAQALRRGALGLYFPGGENTVLEAAEIGLASLEEFEAGLMKRETKT